MHFLYNQKKWHFIIFSRLVPTRYLLVGFIIQIIIFINCKTIIIQPNLLHKFKRSYIYNFNGISLLKNLKNNIY